TLHGPPFAGSSSRFTPVDTELGPRAAVGRSAIDSPGLWRLMPPRPVAGHPAGHAECVVSSTTAAQPGTPAGDEPPLGGGATANWNGLPAPWAPNFDVDHPLPRRPRCSGNQTGNRQSRTFP